MAANVWIGPVRRGFRRYGRVVTIIPASA
jgi:hypothetical protein